MQGLNFQKLEFSFAKGLNQKADPRLVQAPELVRAVDVEFDDVGGLRLRYPFASVGANIFGGGTISNCRRIYACGSELILFTDTALYSWSSQRSAWVLKGTHLAVKVAESAVFINTSNQEDCDRAELSGTVVYCWRQDVAGTDEVFLAAQDTSSGAVLLSPTDVASGTHPRVVALTSTILLFYENGSGDLVARTVNPTTLAISSATTVLAAASFNTYYDVEKIPGADTAAFACRRDTTTAYEVGSVTAALSVASRTESYTCTGPIAVACTPNGETVQLVRTNGTAIVGELFEVSGSTVGSILYDEQALGSGSVSIYQVTAAFADNATCHVFWHSDQSLFGSDWNTEHNTVTVANVIGTESTIVRRAGLASRAFAYDGEVYVWTVFAGTSAFSGASPPEFRAQLQNTYFLFRADGHLTSKAAWQRAGGLRSTGLLPGVVASDATTFSFCGGERRIISLGEKQTGYADTGPRDITITFDSNDARRVAKLGETLYVTGGLPLQYDGSNLVEVGFPIYPWFFGAAEVAAGNLADGVYTLKLSWRFDNARGERERSTTATHGQVTIATGPNGIQIQNTAFPPLHTTRKSGVAVEVWRTAVNAAADAPFFLATSANPADTSNPNRYVENDSTASTLTTFNDELADDDLTTKATHPENYGVLENLAPPAATLIAANDTRLFLAGIPGEPHMVVYSKQRESGLVAAFNDALQVLIPEPGGDITGLAFLNETLVVFRERAIYALDGFGHDNTGGGSNYQARLVSSDVGAVNHESIALTPSGLLFKSSKGWYLLSRGWATQYVGAAVADYDSESIYSAHVVESRHQVRIVTSGRMLVWDYLVDAWAEWSVSDGLHACMWNGTYHYLATASVKAEQSSYSTADYAWDVEMLVHLGSLQGFSRVRYVYVLGEVRGSGTIRFRIGSYAEATYFDDKTWTISPTSAGSELNVRHMPSQQQHKAVRVRLTSQTTAGEKPKLSAISLEVGFKSAGFKLLPSAQKQ